jgi:hypothetical protein
MEAATQGNKVAVNEKQLAQFGSPEEVIAIQKTEFVPASADKKHPALPPWSLQLRSSFPRPSWRAGKVFFSSRGPQAKVS